MRGENLEGIPLRRDGYRHTTFLRRAYSEKRVTIRDSNTILLSLVGMIRRRWHCSRLHEVLYAVVGYSFSQFTTTLGFVLLSQKLGDAGLKERLWVDF